MRVRPRLSSASLQIHRQITLGLPLHAGIMERRRPLPSCTIIFQESMLHRLIPTLGDVMESDPRHFVARYGKADTIIRTCAQGQAGRKRPSNGGTLFSGEEIRTRHSKAILARLIAHSKERFSTSVENHLAFSCFRSAFFDHRFFDEHGETIVADEAWCVRFFPCLNRAACRC